MFKLRRAHVVFGLAVCVLICASTMGIPLRNRWQDERAWKSAHESAQSVGEELEEAVELYRAYITDHPKGRHIEDAEQQIQVDLPRMIEERDWAMTREKIAGGENQQKIDSVCREFKLNYPTSQHNSEAIKLTEKRLDELAEQEWQATQKEIVEAEKSGDLPRVFKVLDNYISQQVSGDMKQKAQAYKQEISERCYSTYMEDGKRSEERKDWEAALAAYRNAGELKPNAPGPREGIEHAQSSERQEKFEAKMQEGAQAEATKDNDSALKIYTKALQMHPGSSDAKQAIARLATEGRLELFAKAMNDGRERETSGDRIGSLDAYKKAIQIDPSSVEAKQCFARLEGEVRQEKFAAAMTEGTQAEANGNGTIAVTAYKKALQIDPDSSEARKAYARVDEIGKMMVVGARAEAARDFAHALPAYQKALQHNPAATDVVVAVERVKKLRISELESKATAAVEVKEWETAHKTYLEIQELDEERGREGARRVDAAELAAKNLQVAADRAARNKKVAAERAAQPERLLRDGAKALDGIIKFNR